MDWILAQRWLYACMIWNRHSPRVGVDTSLHIQRYIRAVRPDVTKHTTYLVL